MQGREEALASLGREDGDGEGGSDDRGMRGAQRDAGGIAKAPSQTCLRRGRTGRSQSSEGCGLGGWEVNRTIEHNWAGRRGSWSGGIHHGLGPGS